MMQPSPDPPYGMAPPIGQMSGLSLGPRPPPGAGTGFGYGPQSNTDLPQSNFPTRSLAAGPPGQPLGPPGQVMSHQQPGAPSTGLSTSSVLPQGPPGMSMMSGPPRGMAMGPPGAIVPGPNTGGQPRPGFMSGPPTSMPPPAQAPEQQALSGPPTAMMMGPPGQVRTPATQMTGPPLSGQINHPSMTGFPMAGPPMSGAQQMVGPPMSGTQQMAGPPTSGPPMSGAYQQMAGPPMSGAQQMAGPPMTGPPPPGQMTGPPMSSSQQMVGPPMSGAHQQMAGLPMSGAQQMAGPPMSGPPMAGPPGAQQMAGPPMSGAQQMAGPPMSGPPMTGPPPPGQMTGPPMSSSQQMVGPPMSGAQQMIGPSMTGPPPPGQMTGPPMGAGPFGQPRGMTGAPPMMGPPGGQFPPGSYPRQPGPPGSYPRQPGPPGTYSQQPGPPGTYPRQPGPPGSLPTAPVQGQPRARINPDEMPNPVAVMAADQEARGGVPFRTSTRGTAPPLVTTQFRALDDGNCSPRYLRATMYSVPCTKDLLNGCKVPLGLVVQPLASIPRDENGLLEVDHGANGPLRCNRCKAYMNPYARFVDGGRKYLCPVCQCSNEVPPEFFCHLDHQGRRTDTLQRPELSFGSVEYIATKDYCKEGKLPLPPAYIFMIDVSYPSVQSGLLSLLSQTILSILDNLPGSTNERGSPIKVGFVTYDKVIHFYNVKASLAQPQMMVLTDVEDVFVPLIDGFLVTIAEARTVLESFLSQLPELFANNKMSQVILEPVVRAGMEALKAAGCNGRLFVFHSALPTAPGPGLLKNRQDPKLLGTDKEKTLLAPAGSVYQKLAEECVKLGVGIELFLISGAYCDVATLAKMASTTGGEVHLYKNYQTSRDGERFVNDLRHSLMRETGFDAVMRVRASTGLRPTGFYGAFFMSNTTDIELGNIDADKAIAVEIKHDDKLREDDLPFFQAALLYTDILGRRRLRVHNIAMSATNKYQDLYRSCDIDSLMSFFSKSIVDASLTMSYKSIRDSFTHQCAVILSCYRKHCSSQSPAGQLILPESLKLLPMYANCLLKSDCLLSPPVVTLDEKCWYLHFVLSLPTALVGPFLYPRVYALHDVNVDDKGLPPLLRCTGQKLSEGGVYVVENGLVTVLWLGQAVPNNIVSQLFGVASLSQVDTDTHILPALDNPLSLRVRRIMAQIQNTRRHNMKLVITKQRDKTEVLFRRLLKEDKGAGQWEGTSYIDFLCNIHREIKEILS